MSDHDDEMAKLRRQVKMRAMQKDPAGRRRAPIMDEDESDPTAAQILLPQFAFVLGFIGLIAGRSIAMNYIMAEPASTTTLGLEEGGVVIAILLVLGLIFGKRRPVSLGALALGAAVAFAGEAYFIAAMPALMEQVYTPAYVAEVLWGPQNGGL